MRRTGGYADRVSKPEQSIRPPVQQRSQRSFERVLQAGLELLEEGGFGAFTLQSVSKRAGVSIGAIYSRVPSREALLLAIHDRAMERITEQERELEQSVESAGLGARELIEALVAGLAGVMMRNRDILRVFMQRGSADPEVLRRGSERSREHARLFESAVLGHRENIAHPDPELAVDIAYRFVYSAIARRITHGPTFESDREISDDRLVRELARAAADYLLGSAER